MAILEIRRAPDPVLSQKAKRVESVDSSIKKLMNDMLQTMYDDGGIGLAANQVGVLKRVLVLDLQDSDDQKRPKGFYPIHMANPEILECSEGVVEAEEGCLSLPQQTITVQRPEKVKVKYIDYNNKEKIMETGGWLARAIQHEMDHLDGKLLIDYVSKLKKDMYIRKLKKIKKLST